MNSKRLLALFCALFLCFGLLAVPASAVATFTGGTSQGTFASKPAAPTVTVSNVASSGKVKVSWIEVAGASKYTLYIYDADGALVKSTTTSKMTLTHNSGKAGEAYTYKVKAKCSVDAAASAYSSARTRTCDLPRPVISVALNTSGKPVISWEAVSGAAKYTLYI